MKMCSVAPSLPLAEEFASKRSWRHLLLSKSPRERERQTPASSPPDVLIGQPSLQIQLQQLPQNRLTNHNRMYFTVINAFSLSHTLVQVLKMKVLLVFLFEYIQSDSYFWLFTLQDFERAILFKKRTGQRTFYSGPQSRVSCHLLLLLFVLLLDYYYSL